jgi:hypothetical protein
MSSSSSSIQEALLLLTRSDASFIGVSSSVLSARLHFFVTHPSAFRCSFHESHPSGCDFGFFFCLNCPVFAPI